MRKRHLRHYWRVQSDGNGDFDELVVHVGHHTRGLMLHAAMLGHRRCFLDVAGLELWVWVDDEGVARITSAKDRRSPTDTAVGRTVVGLRDPALDKLRKAAKKR